MGRWSCGPFVQTSGMTKNQEMLSQLPAEDLGRLDRLAQSWVRRRAVPWQAVIRTRMGGDRFMNFNFWWNAFAGVIVGIVY